MASLSNGVGMYGGGWVGQRGWDDKRFEGFQGYMLGRLGNRKRGKIGGVLGFTLSNKNK